MPFENPPGVLHLFRGRREAPVLRLHHGAIEPAAEPESTLAGGLSFTEGAVRVTDAARRVGHDGSRPHLESQGSGRQFQLSLAIGELLKADEHLHAEVTGHVVAGPAAKLLDPRTRRSDVVRGGDARCRFDVGADLDRARANAPLALETCDDVVEKPDLFGTLGLGIIHLAEPRPHDRLQVGVHMVVIDASKGLGSALPDNRDGVLDEASGMGLEVLGHRIVQVEIDEITPAAPGVVDEAARDHGHGQPGSAHLMSGHQCLPVMLRSGQRAAISTFSRSRAAHAAARSRSARACVATPRSTRRSPCSTRATPRATPARYAVISSWAAAASASSGVNPRFRGSTWFTSMHSEPVKPMARPRRAA